MAFVGVNRFSKGGTYDVALRDGTTVALSARRADFLFRPMRRHGVAFMAADLPVVIPKNEYCGQILRVLDELFLLSDLPLDEERTYPEPRWSLQIHSASVLLLPDGSVDVTSAHGSRGYGTGFPYRSHVPAETYRARLPGCLLEALGERPEEIPGLSGKANAGRRR